MAVSTNLPLTLCSYLRINRLEMDSIAMSVLALDRSAIIFEDARQGNDSVSNQFY